MPGDFNRAARTVVFFPDVTWGFVIGLWDGTRVCTCARILTPPLSSAVPWPSPSLWASARGPWENRLHPPFTGDYWQEISSQAGASWCSVPGSPASHWLGLLLFLLCPHLLFVMLTSLPNYPSLFLPHTSDPPPSHVIWKCSSSPPTFLLHLQVREWKHLNFIMRKILRS